MARKPKPKKKLTAEQQKRKLLEKAGIQAKPSILKKSVARVKEQIKAVRKERRKEQQKILQQQKKEWIEKQTGKKDIKKSELKLGWDKLREKHGGTTLTANDYLYIGFANTTDLSFNAKLLSNKSTDELKEIFFESEAAAAGKFSGSNDMVGVFKFLYGTKAECERAAQIYYERGYNLTAEHKKFVPEQFERITINNEWSEDRFFRLAATCIVQMKEIDKQEFARYLRDYCYDNNLPYLEY